MLGVAGIDTSTPHLPAPSVEIVHYSDNPIGKSWVFQTQDARYLSFNHPAKLTAIQSRINLKNPDVIALDYIKMMLGSLYIQPQPKRVLMMGLGGGALANALIKLIPNLQLDIVEINPDMPQMASTYFNFKPNALTNIYIEDAADFFKKPHAPYDIIYMDTFGDDDIPASLRSKTFTQQLKKNLTPEGIFVVNTLGNSKHYTLKSLPFDEAFNHALYVLDANHIMIASNQSLPELNQIKQNALAWQEKFNQLGIETSWLVERFKIS